MTVVTTSAWALALATPAAADDFCATPDDAARIAEFYAKRPGAMPVVAARELQMSAARVASGLPAGQFAATDAAAFAEVWDVMTAFPQVNFLIMKGQNVFEIMSGVSTGAPSKRSAYFNIKYDNPLRGHLRPDLYASIYAVALPIDADTMARGVMFFDPQGDMVFGAFVSGASMETTPEAVAQFDALMTMISEQPGVCAG